MVRLSPDGTHGGPGALGLPGGVSPLAARRRARQHDAPLDRRRTQRDAGRSPDGTRILFSSDRRGPRDFYVKQLTDGSGTAPLSVRRAVQDGYGLGARRVHHFSADSSRQRLRRLLVAANRERRTELAAGGRLREVEGVVSPDGKWLGYLAEDSGRPELHVQSFPRPVRRIQVTTNTAARWWWTPDSRHLLHATSDLRQLWRIAIEPAGDGLRIGAPVRLANLPAGVHITAIDATPDRSRFLALMPDEVRVPSLTVVQQWPALLEQAIALSCLRATGRPSSSIARRDPRGLR